MIFVIDVTVSQASIISMWDVEPPENNKTDNTLHLSLILYKNWPQNDGLKLFRLPPCCSIATHVYLSPPKFVLSPPILSCRQSHLPIFSCCNRSGRDFSYHAVTNVFFLVNNVVPSPTILSMPSFTMSWQHPCIHIAICVVLAPPTLSRCHPIYPTKSHLYFGPMSSGCLTATRIVLPTVFRHRRCPIFSSGLSHRSDP